MWIFTFATLRPVIVSTAFFTLFWISNATSGILAPYSTITVSYTHLSDDKEKLSTHFNEIGEIVSEASTWAKLSRKKIVTVDYVQKALDKRVERVKKYDQKYTELIEENSLLIDTEGYKVGEINGLTVLTIGDYSFGKPTKITANTFMGKAGVINIERETEMSGSSHSKGILILRGYFGEKFAQDFPRCV